MKYRFYLFVFCSVISFTLHAQNSDSFQSFVTDNSEGRTFHVYQSVFRLANLEGNQDFNKLIKHVDRINVHRFPKPDSTGTNNLAKDLFKIMRDDGYEELISYKGNDSTIRLTMRGDVKKGEFLIFIFSKDGSFVADMDGYFDLRYLGALASGSFDKLQSLMGNNRMSFD